MGASLFEDDVLAALVAVESSRLPAFWFWFEREVFGARCGNGGSVNGICILTLRFSSSKAWLKAPKSMKVWSSSSVCSPSILVLVRDLPSDIQGGALFFFEKNNLTLKST